MTPGAPFRDPASLNVATPPTLKLRLVAQRTKFDISGKTVWGDSYNGDYTGPELHLVPGEHVDLTLVNKLSTPTDLHFHGMHLSPSGDSDNPYISVAPGTSFTYHLDVPLDQPEGTYWYHDHDMCMGNETMAMPGMPASMPMGSCADIESQIMAGLSGPIVVGDDRNLLPESDRGLTVHTMVFKDMQIGKGGTIPSNGAGYSIDSNAPTVRLVNGQLQPILTVQPGQTEMWRLSNAGADIFYKLRLPGSSFTVVGEDGVPVSKVWNAQTLLLPPGKRYDVLVTASENPGTNWLQTLPDSNGPQGDSYPATNLLQVRIDGQAAARSVVPVGALPGSSPSLADAIISDRRTVTLSENAAGTVMFINGKRFDPDKSIFDTPAVLGTVEEWTIRNESGEVHPFHIHTDHFQVMSIDGVPQPFTGDQDIVPIPHEQNGLPGVVVIRIAFTDFTGKVMFHCHIAAHEDAGMMSYIDVVPPAA